MIDHGYTAAAILAIAVAVAADLFVFRTKLVRSKLFWASYGIVVFFQLIVNGILTGLGIVQYDPRVIIGLRLAYAPPEDLGFGFALVTLTLVLWARFERAGTTRPVAPRTADTNTDRMNSA